MFQSSPGPKTGCNLPPTHRRACQRPCFNPHPARRPGATLEGMSIVIVSRQFQSSPGPKTGCNTAAITSRGQPGAFQSSPGPKTGCNLWCPSLFLSHPPGFNPHPARRPGATRNGSAAGSLPGSGFNPHPARRPGATCRCCSFAVSESDMFQSSPGPKTGCNGDFPHKKSHRSSPCSPGSGDFPSRDEGTRARTSTVVRQHWRFAEGVSLRRPAFHESLYNGPDHNALPNPSCRRAVGRDADCPPSVR
jgi:hypothetical protein